MTRRIASMTHHPYCNKHCDPQLGHWLPRPNDQVRFDHDHLPELSRVCALCLELIR